MIKQIEKIIKVVAFENDDGEPCCAKNFDTGEVCEFYRTKSFGTVELCGFDNTILWRRKEGNGTLIPHDCCPIWRKNASL